MNTSIRKLCILTAAALSFTAFGHANEAVQIDGADVGKWTMDFDAAKKLAAEKKLPILVNFTGSDWCGWCKKMDGDVFSKAPWIEFAAQNTLLVTIDFPRDKSVVPERFVARNKELKEKYAVRGYPTYVILDSDGETKIGQLGASRDKTPESFIAEFKNVLRNSPSGMEALAKESPEKAEAYKKAVETLNERKKALAECIKNNEEVLKEIAKRQREARAAEAALSKF